MSDNLNHSCSICGEKYHFCIDCGQAKTFTPWRTIVDTIEHYKIFITIRDYVNNSISKQDAQSQLSECDLSKLSTFVPEIKDKIQDILRQENKDELINKKKSVSKR